MYSIALRGIITFILYQQLQPKIYFQQSKQTVLICMF